MAKAVYSFRLATLPQQYRAGHKTSRTWLRNSDHPKRANQLQTLVLQNMTMPHERARVLLKTGQDACGFMAAYDHGILPTDPFPILRISSYQRMTGD